MTVTFAAYHGTFPDRAESIRCNGVYPSSNNDDWLGSGSYFFVAGLNEPRSSAQDWATCHAWDKHAKRFVTDEVAVVAAVITAPKAAVYDLRDFQTAQEFHRVRRQWLECRRERVLAAPRPDERTYDAELLDEIKADRGIGVVVCNLHIQLSVHERHRRLDSRVPNVSVLCLSRGVRSSADVRVTSVEILHRSDWSFERTYA